MSRRSFFARNLRARFHASVNRYLYLNRYPNPYPYANPNLNPYANPNLYPYPYPNRKIFEDFENPDRF